MVPLGARAPMTLSPSRPLRDFFGSLANLVGAGCHPSRRPDPPFNRTRVCRDLKAREGMGTPEPAFFVFPIPQGCSARATRPLWSAVLSGRLSTASGAAREGKGRIRTLAYRGPSRLGRSRSSTRRSGPQCWVRSSRRGLAGRAFFRRRIGVRSVFEGRQVRQVMLQVVHENASAAAQLNGAQPTFFDFLIDLGPAKPGDFRAL